MKTLFFSFALAISLTAPVAVAQSLGRPGATAGGRRLQSLPEYALGKINPQNREYGADLQSRRDSIVTYTIDDAYFWSNCVTLGLLTVVTGCFLFEIRANDKKEIVAATLISQLWNGRVGDRIELDRRTAGYNALADQQAELVESAEERRKGVSEKPDTSVEAEKTPDKRRDHVRTADPVETRPQPAVGTGEIAEPATPAPDETNTPQRIDDLANDPVALKQEALRLRAQVDAFKNREANLLVRLNKAEEYRRQQLAHQGPRAEREIVK